MTTGKEGEDGYEMIENKCSVAGTGDDAGWTNDFGTQYIMMACGAFKIAASLGAAAAAGLYM